MAGLIHTGETQVAKLAHLTADVAIVDDDRCIPSLRELPLPFVGDGQAGALPAYPITREVAVSVDESDFDAAREEVGDVFEEACAWMIAGVVEGHGDGGGRFGEVEWDAKSTLGVVLVEEAEEVGRGEGIFAWMGDVVPSELKKVGEIKAGGRIG